MFRVVAGVFAVCGILGLAFRPIKAIRVERQVQFGQVSQMTSTCGSNTVLRTRPKLLCVTSCRVDHFGSRPALNASAEHVFLFDLALKINDFIQGA